jgi:hypothetical protein
MFNAPPSVIEATRRAKLREALMELLIKEKKEEITIKCGLKILDMIMNMSEYIRISDGGYISLAGCCIIVERDFDLDPWNIVYEGKVIFN